MKPADQEGLASWISEHPEQPLEIDLQASPPVVRFGGREIRGEIPESTRRSLVEGQWDALAQLLDGREATEAFVARLAATAEGRLTATSRRGAGPEASHSDRSELHFVKR